MNVQSDDVIGVTQCRWDSWLMWDLISEKNVHENGQLRP